MQELEKEMYEVLCVWRRPLRFVDIISTIRGNQNVNLRDRYFYTDVNLC